MPKTDEKMISELFELIVSIEYQKKRSGTDGAESQSGKASD